MEEWLLATDQVCEALELKEVPDHSTLSRAAKRLLKIDILRQMNCRLLTEAGVEENSVALDATGYPMSQASSYYLSRRGRRMRDYWKGAYAVGTSSQMVLAFRQALGQGADSVFLSGLRREVRRYAPAAGFGLLADSGFDGGDVQSDDLIPPVRRGGNLVAADRKARADLVAAARLDGLYGLRWLAEMVHSVIKRKFGDAVRSRLYWLQYREPAIKGLIYNIHR
jgi:hypothetical protein